MNRILEDIRNNDFKRVYLLYGEESFLKRSYLKKLLKGLGVTPGDMNYTVFSDKKTGDDEIIGICETLPFFADRRIVFFDGCDLFKTKREKLAEYCKNLPDYLTLILLENEIDKRAKLYKAVDSAGIAVEFVTPDQKYIAQFAAKKLGAAGKRIRKSTCEYFLSKIGSDLNYINCELEKLIAYTGERKEVTTEDIDAICSPVIENKVFEMVDAAAAGNRKKALEKYDDLIILKEPPMKILAILARQYDLLLHIKELYVEGKDFRQIAQITGKKPFVIKNLIPTARRIPTERLRAAIEDMVRAEEDVKSGRLDERISVELMLMKYSG